MKTRIAQNVDRPLAGISVRNVNVSFAKSMVLDGISMDIEPGEIFAVLGASGCGKSTLLKLIAKLLTPDAGSISFTGSTATRRTGDLSYVFQDATLLPWRTVEENVRLPFELTASHADRNRTMEPGNRDSSAQIDARIRSVLETVGLDTTDSGKFPRELSGGMKMRTSIARALVTDPSILLLDEPFAAMDDILRTRMNDLILELWNERRRSIVFVTHNVAEAIYLSHRVAIMAQGRVARLIENRLPWPRSTGQRTTVGFAELYSDVSAALTEVV